ncbi:EP300-interacting inhibitor of differentiation 3 [Ctenodactylus gundi]
MFAREEEGEKPEWVITCSEYLVKQVKKEAPMNTEVGGTDGCDDFSAGEPDVDPSLLDLREDEDKYRNILKQYRQLIRTVQQNRDNIVNTGSDSLTEALEEANILFDGVNRPREAALDAQFLVLASEKARQLHCDTGYFNRTRFCDFLLIYVGLTWMEGECDKLSSYDDSIGLYFWETVQKEATLWISQAEIFHFVCGSFDPEPSAWKPRLEGCKKAGRMEGRGDTPTKLRKLEESPHQEATEKVVERVMGLLQACFQKYPDTPVSYFEFVTDPNSFCCTVENIFCVSFIVRDGFARIRLDQDRLSILEPININQVGKGNESSYGSRKQGVLSLTLQDWKNIVASFEFEISQAMITKSH